MNTKDRIYQTLQEHFSPSHLVVKDESDRHKGHAGAKQSGGGHYAVTLATDSFLGKSPLERHRMVYDSLRDEVGVTIHALSIQAHTLSEHKKL